MTKQTKEKEMEKKLNEIKFRLPLPSLVIYALNKKLLRLIFDSLTMTLISFLLMSKLLLYV